MFSYAASTDPYAFRLSFTGFWQVQLAGDMEMSAFSALPSYADGQWHSFALRWTSSDGYLELIIDGFDAGFKTGFQAGMFIESGGNFVVGQAQDCLGGCFLPSSEFSGHIAEIQVYQELMLGWRVCAVAAGFPLIPMLTAPRRLWPCLLPWQIQNCDRVWRNPQVYPTPESWLLLTWADADFASGTVFDTFSNTFNAQLLGGAMRK